MAKMSDFHFLRPQFLWFFIPFFLLLFFILRNRSRANAWNKVCSPDLLPYILLKKKKSGAMMSSLLSLLVGSLLITAFAGPAWKTISQPLMKSQSGLVIALDLSPSMDAEDIKPSRLQRAIYKIKDLLDLRKDGQTALIVFSKDPFVVTPLTEDRETIKALLPALSTQIMPSSGHRVSQAITKGAELLSQGGISKGAILLVTSELTQKEMEEAIDIARQKDVKISILGVGTEEGSPIAKSEGGFLKDEKGALVLSKLSHGNLAQLAKSTQGNYTMLSLDDHDLHQLMKGFTTLDHNQTEQTEFQQQRWHDQGYLLVLIALPFSVLFFRRGMWMIVFFLMPHALQALSWNDFWKTPDQQAQELFQQGKYQEAKELFHDQDWQAAAHYQLGEYEEAAQLFQSNPSVEGLYNYGTAKAKQGDLQGALDAYQKVLELQPDHEDSLHNKKIIEEFLKNQEQQNQQDQKNQNKDQNNNNQSKDQKKKDSGQEPSKEQDQKQEGEENQQEQNQEEQQQEGNKQEGQQQESDQNNQQEMSEEESKELQDQYRKKMEEKNQNNEKQQAQEQVAAKEDSSEEDSQRQVDERWLQRIEDDPGGLLRRKFLHQYRQQNRNQ
jgi:Ca-activated chloride channel family protein